MRFNPKARLDTSRMRDDSGGGGGGGMGGGLGGGGTRIPLPGGTKAGGGVGLRADHRGDPAAQGLRRRRPHRRDHRRGTSAATTTSRFTGQTPRRTRAARPARTPTTTPTPVAWWRSRTPSTTTGSSALAAAGAARAVAARDGDRHLQRPDLQRLRPGVVGDGPVLLPERPAPSTSTRRSSRRSSRGS